MKESFTELSPFRMSRPVFSLLFFLFFLLLLLLLLLLL